MFFETYPLQIIITMVPGYKNNVRNYTLDIFIFHVQRSITWSNPDYDNINILVIQKGFTLSVILYI